MNDPARNKILLGDVRTQLAKIPDASVDAVITSPPYFALRDYGQKRQIGLEASVDGWVNEIVTVMQGVARVLKPTGTVWLNVADRYSRHDRMGATPKSLLGGPERLMLALIADGWIIRNRVIWAKPNPLPDSVKDRLTASHETIFLLSRSPKYFFDLDAIRVAHQNKPTNSRAFTNQRPDSLERSVRLGRSHHPLGKNPGDVWSVPVSAFRGAHFATFPERLVERPLLASVPERTCSECGEPWMVRTLGALAVDGTVPKQKRQWSQACDCAGSWRPGLVLDPFMGAGTVAVVAEDHGRDWLGIELNPDYRRLAMQRVRRSSRKTNKAS